MKLDWERVKDTAWTAIGDDRRYEVKKTSNSHYTAKQYYRQQMIKAQTLEGEYAAKERCQTWENAKRYTR